MKEITYEDLRRQRRLRDDALRETEAELQRIAGLLTSEYIKSLYLPKSNGRRRGHIRNDGYVHIGLDCEGYVEWSTSYSQLEMDDELKMFFPIRTLLGEDLELDSDEAVIYCLLNFEEDSLFIELQCEEGEIIEKFKYSRRVEKNDFRKISQRIKEHIFALLETI